ncbi:MAG: serine/threonine protein kinase [bacterium]|nr:serine/threonine protein kinase [bacterium]
MSDPRHARVKTIFAAVCARPPEEWPDLLARECAHDPELRDEVESLLRFHDCTAEEGPTVEVEKPELKPGGSIGHYSILRLLGEGGMGEVWEAEQREPVRRRVALKLIKAGMSTKQVVARFESERQALALMDHPNIARVFDAGATERGRPYFVMEYVRGERITTYCDRHRLTTRQRLELFLEVCDGVQHAHHKGVIHRDIKPSNLLVSIQDDRPTPKIIDFGVAKATSQPLTSKTMVTQLGMLIGTPEYMSPEQAETTTLDIDTRTDVYSLGVVLYELLVGAPPFEFDELRVAGVDELRRKVREDEAPRPSLRFTSLGGRSTRIAAERRTDPPSLARQLRGELDWIVMRALEKDRTRRYASPAEIAGDIHRHLNDEPVLAGPPSAVYRVRKFVRRHRLGVIAASMVLLALLVGATATTFGMLRAQSAEAGARRDAATAEQVSGFLVGLFQVSDPSRARGNTITAREILDQGAGRIRDELIEQPEVQARMMATIGAVYRGLGLYDPAQDLLEEALVIRETHLAPDDPAILWNLFDLAWLAMELNDYARAAEITERFMPLAHRILDPDSAEFARVLAGVGMVRWDEQRYAESEELLSDAIAIWDRQTSVSDPFMGTALDGLGRALARKDQLDQALENLKRAQTFRRRTLGPDHPDMAASMIFLADVHERRGEHAQAQALHRRALELVERTRGADHPIMVEALRLNAGFLHHRGEVDKARSFYERALDLAEQVARPVDQDLPGLVEEYADLLVGLGEYEGVRALHDRVLAFFDPQGVDHPSYSPIAYHLGQILANRQAYEEARFYAERALAARERNLAPDDESLAWTLNLTARTWEYTGKLEEATALFERALGIVERERSDDPDLSWLLTGLGWNLTRLERFDEARAFHERSIRLVEDQLGPEHPRMVPALDGLAAMYWRMGRFEDSRPLGARALSIRESEVGREDRDVVRRYYNLACIWARIGDRDEAMDRLRQAIDRGFSWGGIADDPDMDSLRGDPGFEAIVDEIERRNAIQHEIQEL